ncbi:hypothetical protein [Natronosalvus rutilus]|uniref:Uncharacterized protein n=1 Tax=Natronosalvus rutilus TaxID=2953753 RepID=A0A9E7N6X4_9EURY|nr:hypothetical protein [Natronosalvus rutilus]UTF52829.1 hypothetical protein NGM29_13710 [Natronosalvus rutilus]
MSHAVETMARSRQAGDRAETAVLELVDGLRYVPDSEGQHYDAVAETVIVPHRELPFVGICLLEADAVVEIKSVAVVYGQNQRRGRFSLRRVQHQSLLEEGGVYLFAVCTPNSREIIGMKVVPATQVDHLLESVTDGWRTAGDGREDYSQLAWTRIFDSSELRQRGDEL